ncbi:MAG: beta-glucosidase [Synechococcaceae cyanobacterium RL_1_2]|nr:beta-glucosidase [Synechococcaceae cyanobacterium RL_1_2]
MASCSGDGLSLKQKIGQMIVVRASGQALDHGRAYPQWEATQEQLTYWLRELNIGGVILLGGTASEVMARTQQLQRLAPNPLLIAADIEEGVGQRFTGATVLPPPMALGAIAKQDLPLAKRCAYDYGKITAQEALAIGINWILAPVADINNNPSNPVINVRAFGEEPRIVKELITAFINGAAPYPALTTVKHFPGHGDTDLDSHLDLPTLTHHLDRLTNLELIPFIAGLEAGVDSVMTAHLLIEAWDQQWPATLSPSCGHYLRHTLNYDGLIVTDALIMGGVTNQYDPITIARQAVLGGADILLMPQEPTVAIDAIATAVEQDLISLDRINQSYQRIQTAKAKLAFNSTPPSLNQLLQTPAAIELSRNILVHSQINTLPSPVAMTAAPGANVIIVDRLLFGDFLSHQSPALTIPKSWGYPTFILEQPHLHFPTDQYDRFLIQIFSRGNPFKGKVNLSSELIHTLEQLNAHHPIVAIVIYGSPYLSTQLPSTIPVIFSYGQMPLAQAIALQALTAMSGNENLTKQEFT